jgi:molybdate transport system substrate-binding protein
MGPARRRPAPAPGLAPAIAASLGAAVAVVLVAGGCGGDDPGGDRLVVSAAASLEPAFTAYAQRAGFDARQSFAGSDDLAAQIRQGATPDVYAAANTSLPNELHAEGFVGEPTVFATNELVVAVPADSRGGIGSIDDLARAGLAIAIGDEGVPVGDYAREVLDRVGESESGAILANVRSEEPDVGGIVGKLTQGAVDAGFVYRSDVLATDGALRAVALPASLRPRVAYGAAVVHGASNPGGARAFIDGLVAGAGGRVLRDSGFGPPPR